MMKALRNLSLALLLVLCLVGIAGAEPLAVGTTKFRLELAPHAEVKFGSNGPALRASIPDGGTVTTPLTIRTNTRLDVNVESGGYGTAAGANDKVNPFITYTITRDDSSIVFSPKTSTSFVTSTNTNERNGVYEYTFTGTFDASFDGAEWWGFTADLHYFDTITVTVSPFSSN
jgi:hypothetical protein